MLSKPKGLPFCCYSKTIQQLLDITLKTNFLAIEKESISILLHYRANEIDDDHIELLFPKLQICGNFNGFFFFKKYSLLFNEYRIYQKIQTIALLISFQCKWISNIKGYPWNECSIKKKIHKQITWMGVKNNM